MDIIKNDILNNNIEIDEKIVKNEEIIPHNRIEQWNDKQHQISSSILKWGRRASLGSPPHFLRDGLVSIKEICEVLYDLKYNDVETNSTNIKILQDENKYIEEIIIDLHTEYNEIKNKIEKIEKENDEMKKQINYLFNK